MTAREFWSLFGITWVSYTTFNEPRRQLRRVASWNGTTLMVHQTWKQWFLLRHWYAARIALGTDLPNLVADMLRAIADRVDGGEL